MHHGKKPCKLWWQIEEEDKKKDTATKNGYQYNWGGGAGRCRNGLVAILGALGYPKQLPEQAGRGHLPIGTGSILFRP